MANGDEIKLPLTSRDANAARVAQLRELFPEAFTEGKIDLTKFPQLLGDVATDAPERYGLSWSGKSEAIKNIQTLTSGTLLPVPEESWPPLPFAATESPRGLGVRQPSAALASQAEAAPEKRQRAGAVQDAGATDAPYQQNTSENLIIEGDNLEVLKLLQGGYHGCVKMIYIDPPYNTGGEFIYPDNYREGLADYLKFSGQVSGEGIRLTTNAETDGRYHSKWLTMMYPRLFLARNLLRKDGVIFVSIDDHEVHNLRAVMNEIFGEENFVATFVWKRRASSALAEKLVSVDHEYVIAYHKGSLGCFAGIGKDYENYSNPDKDPNGDWTLGDLTVGMTKEQRPNQFYDLVDPKTGRRFSANPNRVWAFIPESMSAEIAEGRVIFPDNSESRPMVKRYRQNLIEARKTGGQSAWRSGGGVTHAPARERGGTGWFFRFFQNGGGGTAKTPAPRHPIARASIRAR